MKDSERARSLVRKIVRAAKRAETLAKARGNKDFSAQANEVRAAITELLTLRLLPKRRKEFATTLETQGALMTRAMVLSGYLCNAAKALCENPTPATVSA